MLKKLRKSSGTVTLVLVGVAALAGCNDSRRDVYASKQDCLADWGNKPEDCTPATDPKYAGRNFFYGPLYAASALAGGGGSSGWDHSSGTYSRSTSRSVGSSGGSSSRGGFGSSGRSSSSGS